METPKDPRILGLELAARVLEEAFRSKKPFYVIPKREEKSILQEVSRLVSAIKRSYMEPEDLAEAPETKRLVEIGRSLRDQSLGIRSKEGPHIYLARLMFVGRTFRSFPERLLARDASSMVAAIDIVAASAIAVHKITERLLLVRAGDGLGTYDVVTNIPHVRRGEVRPIAFLPPKEFHGHVSEAMFASREPIEAEPGERILRKDRELEGIVGRYLKHYGVVRFFYGRDEAETRLVRRRDLRRRKHDRRGHLRLVRPHAPHGRRIRLTRVPPHELRGDAYGA